jgi:hypothetical protein
MIPQWTYCTSTSIRLYILFPALQSTAIIVELQICQQKLLYPETHWIYIVHLFLEPLGMKTRCTISGTWKVDNVCIKITPYTITNKYISTAKTSINNPRSSRPNTCWCYIYVSEQCLSPKRVGYMYCSLSVLELIVVNTRCLVRGG